MQFTTSWDDGYALDLRLAAMLTKYGCTGTFYVCPLKQHGREMLTKEQIKELSDKHEIGAHTLTHPHLTALPHDRAEEEIRGSKLWVEQVTGKECTMFCYPYGDESQTIREIVKQAGYRGARTTERLRFSTIDPFAAPVTLQISPFPFRKSFRPLWKVLDPLGPLRSMHRRLKELGVPLSACRSWLSLAKALFDGAQERSEPFFHLYGHSHEIEKYGMWEELETFLEYVRRSVIA